MNAPDPSEPETRPSLDEEMLEDYLNQHLLGSRPGVPAFRAAADTWKDTPHEQTLRAIADDVQASQDHVRELIDRLGFTTSASQQALGAAASVGGRVNPVNIVRSRRSGWTQVELEILTGALRSQSELWRLLETLAPYDARLDAVRARERYERTLGHMTEVQAIIDATLLDRFLADRESPTRG